MERMSNSEVSIKAFEEADIPILIAGKETVDAQELSEASVLEFVKIPNNFLFVARTETVLAGLASGYYLREIDGAQTTFLYEIDIAPSFQQQGIATRLIEYIAEQSRQQGISHLWVVASKENEAAMALYKNTGAQMTNDQAVVWEYDLKMVR
jgi:aminoglycoside 6'-N-acetyltransferase I